jgi:hypothetical protein
MNWKDIIKISPRDRDMYLDASNLIEKIHDAVDLKDINEFVAKYDEVGKEPIEWPTMHDYLLAVSQKFAEINVLNSNIMKVLKAETDEALEGD